MSKVNMNPYINNLTALRGVASLMIVVMHFHLWYGEIVPDVFDAFINKFYLMVDLFFILSGFVMCYVYQDMFAQKVNFAKYKHFLWLRLARIYPLHFMTLLAHVCLLAVHVSTDTFSSLDPLRQFTYQVSAIPMQLFFMDSLGFFNFATWNTPAWSLSAEWWSYVLFPIIFYITIKLRGWALLILPIVVLSTWYVLEFHLASTQPFMDYPGNPNKQDLNLIWHWGVLRGIAGFVAGMFVFQLYTRNILSKFIANGWLIGLLSILVMVNMFYQWWDTVTVSLFMVMVLACAYGSKRTDAFFNIGILQKLGDWSFSMYMWHHVLFNIFTSVLVLLGIELQETKLNLFGSSAILNNLVSFVVYTLIVLLVARMSFEYLEKPSRKFLRKRIG